MLKDFVKDEPELWSTIDESKQETVRTNTTSRARAFIGEVLTKRNTA
jgi:hypothetical protein